MKEPIEWKTVLEEKTSKKRIIKSRLHWKMRKEK